MSDRFQVFPQYLLPKQALTAFAGFVAGREHGWVTTEIIRRFVAKYQVNMQEAAQPDITAYRSFNDFFTRALKPGARPLADAALICPVDGAISQFGRIENDQIFQAKGHRYSTTALVGGDTALAKRFDHGSFATLYLSPKDYHRIHMPCDGELQQMIYVPGELFSVNPLTARGVPGLFARNERLVCVFDSAAGPFVMVLVGATIVGSMATVWHGPVVPVRSGRLPSRVAQMQRWSYGAASSGHSAPVLLRQGEEMGRFLLGSTVVMLFDQAGALGFNPAWQPGGSIRLGEAMAGRGALGR